MKKLNYSDAHNFKFAGIPTQITTGPYSAGPPVTGGPLSAGAVITQSTASLSPTGRSLYNVAGVFQFCANTINPANWKIVNTTFDRYKINKITVRVIPEFSVSDQANTGTLPVMKVVRDLDDAMVPSLGDVWARRGTLHRLNKPFTITLKPKVAFAISNATLGGYAPMPAPWINTTYAAIPHLGVKFGIKDFFNSITPNNGTIRFEIMYYVSVREQLSVGAVGDEYTQLQVNEDGAVVDPSGNIVVDTGFHSQEEPQL